MKKKVASLLLACVVLASFAAGCSKSDSKKRAESTRAEHNDVYGDIAYETTAMESEEWSDSLDLSYEQDVADDGQMVNPGTGNADTKADAKKEMLVFRCTIALDTLNFEESVTALKTKIAEYHGFVERENQSDGNNSNGRYILDEEDKDYYYTATIRIPSEYYESFVSAASGIGTLRSKNSSVDNVATRYGTLQSDLEIYEAEYDRYLKQYNETEDETVALQIQRELRDLAITISNIKTEMSMLESDVAYSYVTITIHKVSEKEIKKEEKEVKEEDSFGTKLSKTAQESWDGLLGFLQGIVLFFVANWWILLLILIAFGLVFFFSRRSIKKARAKAEAQRKEFEAHHAERMKAYQAAKDQVEAESRARNVENQAQIQARIASQRAAEQAEAAKAEASETVEEKTEDPDVEETKKE